MTKEETILYKELRIKLISLFQELYPNLKSNTTIDFVLKLIKEQYGISCEFTHSDPLNRWSRLFYVLKNQDKLIDSLTHSNITNNTFKIKRLQMQVHALEIALKVHKIRPYSEAIREIKVIDYIPHSKIAEISMGVKVHQIIITIKDCSKYCTFQKITTDSNGITGKFTKL